MATTYEQWIVDNYLTPDHLSDFFSNGSHEIQEDVFKIFSTNKHENTVVFWIRPSELERIKPIFKRHGYNLISMCHFKITDDPNPQYTVDYYFSKDDIRFVICYRYVEDSCRIDVCKQLTFPTNSRSYKTAPTTLVSKALLANVLEIEKSQPHVRLKTLFNLIAYDYEL